MDADVLPGLVGCCLILLAGCSEPAPQPVADGPPLQVVGDSEKRKRSEPPPASSARFDGHRVRLRGVRGETLGVQVLLWQRPAAEVALRLDAPGVRVDAFAVHHVQVRDPSSSMYGDLRRGPGWYPDRLEPVAQPVATDRAALFDVAIAADAAPGDYTGELRVGDDRYPVALRVEPLAIDLRDAPLVWVWYSARQVAATHGVADGSPEQLAHERRYVDLFRAHGAYLSIDLDRDRAEARAPWLEGVRYWPVWIDHTSARGVMDDARFWAERARAAGAVAFSIPIDEPRRPGARLRVRALGHLVDLAGAGDDAFLLAVTDAPDAIYGDAVDAFISYKAFPRKPYGGLDRARRWTYNGGPPHAGSMVIDTAGTDLRTWGWIAYRYDIELWYAWEGLYFHDRYNDGSPTDVTTDPITFDQRPRGGEDWGNGDGVLAYPGALPSLRLKALRRGLQDRLLLRRLEACGAGERARALVARMVPRALGEAGARHSWPADAATWDAARDELLDALLQECGDGR